MNEADLQAEVTRLDEQIGRAFRERAPLLEQLAELRGPAVLPKPQYRTEKQSAISRCPRCGECQHDFKSIEPGTERLYCTRCGVYSTVLRQAQRVYGGPSV